MERPSQQDIIWRMAMDGLFQDAFERIWHEIGKSGWRAPFYFRCETKGGRSFGPKIMLKDEDEYVNAREYVDLLWRFKELKSSAFPVKIFVVSEEKHEPTIVEHQLTIVVSPKERDEREPLENRSTEKGNGHAKTRK